MASRPVAAAQRRGASTAVCPQARTPGIFQSNCAPSHAGATSGAGHLPCRQLGTGPPDGGSASGPPPLCLCLRTQGTPLGGLSPQDRPRCPLTAAQCLCLPPQTKIPTYCCAVPGVHKQTGAPAGYKQRSPQAPDIPDARRRSSISHVHNANGRTEN
jgi:hypothetical protein